MRYAARTDANQREIIAALEAVGASVFPSFRLGGGFPDLVVGFRGATYLLEVKTPTGRLTPAEERFFAQWRGHAAVVHDAEEALRAIGAV